MIILGLLPIVTILLLSLAIPDRTRCWGDRLLDSLLVWGVLIVVLTEGLSLFGLLSSAWTTVLWLLLVLILVLLLARSRRDMRREISRKLAALFVDQKELVAGDLLPRKWTRQ